MLELILKIQLFFIIGTVIFSDFGWDFSWNKCQNDNFEELGTEGGDLERGSGSRRGSIHKVRGTK